jgi:hypothetical protein
MSDYPNNGAVCENKISAGFKRPSNRLSQLTRRADRDAFRALTITWPKVGAASCRPHVAGSSHGQLSYQA